MTVIMPFGRTVTRHVFSKSNHVLTRLATSNPVLRVSYGTCDSNVDEHSRRSLVSPQNLKLISRGYATAAAASKPAGRPKAHKGRATTKKTTSKAKEASSKKPAKKPVKKTKTKATVKAKPRSKSRAKKPPGKTALNQARILRVKDLKKRALLTEPKRLPENSWIVFLSEHKGKVNSLQESIQALKDLAPRFQNITPEEREKINHTVNQNKAKNHAEYQKWLKSYTPSEIKAANNARILLNKEKKKDGKKIAPVHLIKDERLVKHPVTAYLFFVQDRYSSGDFRHMKIVEATRLIAREWKALSESERRTYEDKAAADRSRYHEETASVYGTSP